MNADRSGWYPIEASTPEKRLRFYTRRPAGPKLRKIAIGPVMTIVSL